jgi:hypothetical protein
MGVVADVSSTYTSIVTALFSSTIAAKAWFATAAVGFGVTQPLTAARIYGKLGRALPLSSATVARVHRYSGRLAFVCTLPVVFHCVFILGFRTTDLRVAVHSIAGSFVYGVFAAKVLFVRSRGYPWWVLPLAGGSLLAVLTTLWVTSAGWYFTNVRFGF